jgi:hypothetical protein
MNCDDDGSVVEVCAHWYIRIVLPLRLGSNLVGYATQEIRSKTSEAHKKKNGTTLKPKNSVDKGGKVGAKVRGGGVVIPDHCCLHF